MKINNVNQTQSFSKTPLLTCRIKDIETKKANNATLYKMSPYNSDDIQDIMLSKNTKSIKRDFLDEYKNQRQIRNFYVMQNDKTGEIISCAQTQHRYRENDSINPGLYTLIEEIDSNEKYINPVEPLLAYIVKNAQDQYDSNVITAFGTEKVPSLKHAKFAENKLGEYFIPQKRYNSLINQAEEHSQIEYIV